MQVITPSKNLLEERISELHDKRTREIHEIDRRIRNARTRSNAFLVRSLISDRETIFASYGQKEKALIKAFQSGTLT